MLVHKWEKLLGISQLRTELPSSGRRGRPLAHVSGIVNLLDEVELTTGPGRCPVSRSELGPVSAGNEGKGFSTGIDWRSSHGESVFPASGEYIRIFGVS